MLFRREDIGVETDNHDLDTKAAPVSPAFASRFLNVETYKVAQLPADISRLPTAGEIFFLQTMASYNAFTLVQCVANLHLIEELWASTYSVSLKVLEALQEMRNKGQLGSVRLLISDSMRQRNPRVCDAIEAWSSNCADVTIIYTWNHSKITLLRTADDFFCIEGSGNWSKNAQYEQYIFANDQKVFDLRKELFYDAKVIHRIN